jgi:hypothetical protein
MPDSCSSLGVLRAPAARITSIFADIWERMLPGPEESYLRSDSQHSSTTGGGRGLLLHPLLFSL